MDYTSHFKTYSPETAIKEISLRVAAEITGLQRMFNSLQSQRKRSCLPCRGTCNGLGFHTFYKATCLYCLWQLRDLYSWDAVQHFSPPHFFIFYQHCETKQDLPTWLSNHMYQLKENNEFTVLALTSMNKPIHTHIALRCIEVFKLIL